MGLKSTLNLLLLFCSLNLILNQEEQTLGPNSPVNFDGNKQRLTINIGKEELKNYITIKFALYSDSSINPVVIVAKDDSCDNQRITMTDQKFGNIFIFLKKEQVELNGKLYLCINNRESTYDIQRYSINVTNDDKANLPLDQQTSYFVNKETTDMEITFPTQENYEGNKITFWVKGKDIDNEKTHMDSTVNRKINGGKAFYASYVKPTNLMSVHSSEGDYVTVGSTGIKIKTITTTIQKLIKNGNEIIVAGEIKEICIPLKFEESFSSITGKLYNLKAKTYFIEKESGEKINEIEVQDGVISQYNDIKKLKGISNGYYCVSSDNEIALTIQMVSFKDNIIVTPPAFPGEIRRYIMQKGEIAIFSAMAPIKEAKKLNFNMKSLKGFSELYFVENQFFPMVSYTYDYFTNKEHPLMNNRFATYIYHLDEEKKKFNYLSSTQPLMTILCTEGSISKFTTTGEFCEIEVSIFTNKDTINIIEEAPFSQYLAEGETNTYKIKIPNDMPLNSKISIDLTLFTGDAEINTETYWSDKFNKYYLSNKVFYSIDYSFKKEEFMEFTVKAKKNVFYMVNYLLIYNGQKEDKITLESGINYITSKDVDDSNKDKIIYLKNFRYETSKSYMASFYSPNCQYTLTQNIPDSIKLIDQYDNYANVILEGNLEKYLFTYNIEKDDGFKYPNKFCMVYAAGLELDNSKNWNGRSISLSEGLPHIFTYSTDSKYSHYSYYILNKNNSVVINFNLLDKASFNIYLRIDKSDYYNTEIYRNKQLNITSKMLNGRCPDQYEICKLDIICEALNLEDSKEQRKVEITVYQLNKNPVYLEKNRVKNDFINGNTEKHYYFDISGEEYGDITLNFKRGSGSIYGIVESRKKESSTPSADADWRGVYKFPTADTPNALKFRAYGKKLLISEDDTKDCNEGCYVLITVKSNRYISTESVDDAQYPFRISLNPRIIPKNKERDNPKVKIGLNEFIFGDLFWLNLDIRRYDYYQVILTHDSNEVVIDWQADSPYLLINVGEELPKLYNCHKQFEPLGDFVYRLSRAEILAYAGRPQTDSLKDIVLTIGIYANISDSIESSPYAFKIFEPPLARDNEKIASELIHIRADQKVQCLPLVLEKKYYLCLFSVIFDETDLKNNLVLYPRSLYGKRFVKYGKTVEAQEIEKNDVNKILDLTLDTLVEANIKTDDFIYEENVQKGKAYFLIIQTEDDNDLIDVLSSTYAYENGMTFVPNPSTAQLFALQDKYMYFSFPTKSDLLLNINSISGIGYFKWEEEGETQQRDMYLKGRGDRLSFTTLKDPDKLPKLSVTSTNGITKAGFVFYITYYPRTYVDQLKTHTFGEIHYRTVEMPLNFYAHVGYGLPWIVNLNFYDIIPKLKTSLTYENDLFAIWGTVVSEEDAYTMRYDRRLSPKPIEDNKIYGQFDAFYGALYLSEDDVERIMNNTSKAGKVPYVFFSIENKTNLEFDTIGLEADVHSLHLEEGRGFAPEGVYITGKLDIGKHARKIYRLKINRQNPYIRIEYSGISSVVKFALSFNHDSETTDKFKHQKFSEESGRKILIVKLSEEDFKKGELFFIAFQYLYNEEKNADKLDYYVFKYLTAPDSHSYLPIKNLTNSKVKVVEKEDGDKKMLSIEFEPIKYKDVSYFIKAIYTKDYVRGEDLNSIAMSESEGMNMLVNVHEGSQQKLLTYDLEIPKEKDVLFLKIMAIFGFADEKIIYLYSPVDVSEGREAPSKELGQSSDIQVFNLNSRFRFIKGIMSKETIANKKQKYQVIFEERALLLEYVKIEVTHNGTDSPTVCISNSDKDCMIHRDQLSKGGSKTTEIFVKKDQFYDNFYFTVECHDTQNCNYNILITKQHEAVFNHLGIFNYYVSEDNKEMVFKFMNNEENKNGILNAYATGGKKIRLEFINCNGESCPQHNISYGAGIITNIDDLEFFRIKVNADIGDYISLGLKYFSNEQEKKVNLTPQTGQITGLLRKGVLEEECYILPESTDYITGRFYDNNANIKLTNLEKTDDYTSELQKTENWFFYAILKPTDIPHCLCFSLSNKEVEYSAYSLQIESISKFKGNLFLPQNTPIIYPRIIPKGKAIMLNSLLPKIESEHIVYNMIVKTGYPKMYIYKCQTYPLCEFDPNDVTENQHFKRISDINGMSSFFTDEIHTPIDSTQNLLVFKCNDANGTENYEYDHCEVLSTIFGEKEVVQLIEKQPFGRYNTPDINNHYLIDFSSIEEKWFKIHIDFLVVSGDVDIDIQNGDDSTETIDAHKYYLSNKIFYSITVDKNAAQNVNLKKILIDTKARNNSYYIVEYKIIRDQDEDLYKNNVRTGINYLVPITTSNQEIGNLKKIITIESLKIIQPEIFIASFYSLNCDFEIEKIYSNSTKEKIKSFGRYAQDFYVYQDDIPRNTNHSYLASVVNKQTLYQNDMCMLYVSGIDLYKRETKIRKEVLVSEGIPQRMIFENPITKIRYVFPHADPKQNLACSINMIVPGKIRLNIFFREQEDNINKNYTQSGIFYLKRDTIQKYCNESYERCSVTVELEVLEIFNNEPPITEFSIKKEKNTPYYFPRGIQRKDYITNDAYLFLYTDIGDRDEGYVSFDFNRGSGFVYGKIVKVDQEEMDEGADWRKYRFIRYKDEKSLGYDFFNKRINFVSYNTRICQNGCFLLLSVVSSVLKIDQPPYDFHSFNILAGFNLEFDQKRLSNKIEIYPDEFVIGLIDSSDRPIEENVDNYTIICPYKAEEIEIDWQTNFVKLNVKINDYEKDFLNNRNSLIHITKDEILEQTKLVDNTLKNVEIKLKAKISFEEAFGSAYTFRVHFRRDRINIHKVSSDQKVICTPTKIDEANKYRCLFIVVYKDTEIFNDLFVYPKSQDPSAKIEAFADYITSEIYDKYDVDKLEEAIPVQGKARFDTTTMNTSFLFIQYGDFNSHALISVISDNNKDIELLTSFKTLEEIIEPNPRSEQIYSLDLLKKDIHINFNTRQSISINIKSLFGEGNYSFDHDESISFYLRGEDDKLNYIIRPLSSDEYNTALNVENLRFSNFEYKQPGCAFVLEFNRRNSDIELDSIKIGETKEIANRELPYNIDVYYYAKIQDTSKDVDGFFYLHDIEYGDKESEERTITSGEILFKAMVVDESKIEKIKDGRDKIPEDFYVEGVYDATLKAGSIHIDKRNYTNLENPTLLVTLRKNEKSKISFKRLRGEIGFNYVNSDVPVIQKLYQFGKIEGRPNDMVSYKLKTNIKVDGRISEYTRVQFSTNSEFVNFAINKGKGIKVNDTFIKPDGCRRERGLTFVTFETPKDVEYLYLNVFLKDNSNNDKKLNNYVFKYINAYSNESFYEFKLIKNDPSIKVEKGNETIKVLFNPINYDPKAHDDLLTNIIYNVKVVPKDTYIKNEKTDLIAITESPVKAKQFKHTGIDMKTARFDGINYDYAYVQVIAALTHGSFIEYVAYQAVDSNGKVIDPSSNPKDDKTPVTPTDDKKPAPPDNKNKALIAIIVVSCFLFVVVVVLVVVIVMYNSKNKDLLTQVNKISFVQSGASAKDDANLLLDNQNELD